MAKNHRYKILLYGLISVVYLGTVMKAESSQSANDSEEYRKRIANLEKYTSENYEKGMRARQEAEKSYKEAVRLEKVNEWRLKNAKLLNPYREKGYIEWLKKQHMKGKIREHYTTILNNKILLIEYVKDFLKEHHIVFKEIFDKDIKDIKDVNDKNMWACERKTLSIMLK